MLDSVNKVMEKHFGVVTFIDHIRTKDQKVITNMKRYYERNKDFCIYEDNFYTIIEKFENGTYDTNYIVFYDELFSLLEKGKLHPDILTFISQMRKRGIYLLTTVQEWLDINVTFRRYCRFYIECHSFNILGRCYSWNVVHDGYQIHWDNLLNEYDAPIIQTNFHKNQKRIADSYDTFEVIARCVAKQPPAPSKRGGSHVSGYSYNHFAPSTGAK